MNVKFNVFTKASNECDPTVDGNDAPSGVLRVVPFEDPLQLIPLLLNSNIRSEGSIAIVKKFDFDFFIILFLLN